MTSPGTAKLRVAFDLDMTLGVPIKDGRTMISFQTRRGCAELLGELQTKYTLLLWTISSKPYAMRALSFGLGQFFTEIYTRDDMPCLWKDVRTVRADYLVDDAVEYREAAKRYGLEARYIIVSPYGTKEDSPDPLAWARQVRNTLL